MNTDVSTAYRNAGAPQVPATPVWRGATRVCRHCESQYSAQAPVDMSLEIFAMRTVFTALAFLVILWAVIPAVQRCLIGSPPRPNAEPDQSSLTK